MCREAEAGHVMVDAVNVCWEGASHGRVDVCIVCHECQWDSKEEASIA